MINAVRYLIKFTLVYLKFLISNGTSGSLITFPNYNFDVHDNGSLVIDDILIFEFVNDN